MGRADASWNYFRCITAQLGLEAGMRKPEIALSNKPCHRCLGAAKEIDHAATARMLLAKRMEAGIAQSAVARAMSLHKSSVCRLEGGSLDWTHELIGKYLAALNTCAPANL